MGDYGLVSVQLSEAPFWPQQNENIDNMYMYSLLYHLSNRSHHHRKEHQAPTQQFIECARATDRITFNFTIIMWAYFDQNAQSIFKNFKLVKLYCACESSELPVFLWSLLKEKEALGARQRDKDVVIGEADLDQRIATSVFTSDNMTKSILHSCKISQRRDK